MGLSTDTIEDRAHEALKLLTDTDTIAADLSYHADMAKHKYDATVDAHFLVIEGTVEVRKAAARHAAEAEYLAYLEAERRSQDLVNQRRTAMAVVDWCRTLCSNRRQGS